MTAKELLNQYELDLRKEKRIESFISSQKEIIDSLDLIPSRLNRQMKDRLFELNNQLRINEEELSRLSDEKQRILDLIKEIPGEEGEVLTRRYVNGEIWDEICANMSYSWNGVFGIHRRALRTLQDLLDQSDLFDT